MISSNVTEHGDIIKPKNNYNDNRKLYQPIPFWSGFFNGDYKFCNCFIYL